MSQSKRRNVNALSSKVLLPPLHVLPTPTKTGRASKTGETGETGETGRSGPWSPDPTVQPFVQPSSRDVGMGAVQSVEGSEPLIVVALTSSCNSCFVCNQGIREATMVSKHCGARDAISNGRMHAVLASAMSYIKHFKTVICPGFAHSA